MEPKQKAPQQVSPFLPNAGQIRELRITMGKEKASECLEKIIDATTTKYNLSRSLAPADRLFEIIKRTGLSLQYLSKKTGISETSLSAYRDRKRGRIPRRHLQEKIADALGVTRAEIWGSGEER